MSLGQGLSHQCVKKPVPAMGRSLGPVYNADSTPPRNWHQSAGPSAPKALKANHLEERLLDQAQTRASYTPLFWGHSRSIP